jgi:hypothetical protein
VSSERTGPLNDSAASDSSTGRARPAEHITASSACSSSSWAATGASFSGVTPSTTSTQSSSGFRSLCCSSRSRSPAPMRAPLASSFTPLPVTMSSLAATCTESDAATTWSR